MQSDKSLKLNDEFFVDKTKLLGKGNFGSVHKGYSLSQNKIIAVKYITTQQLKEQPDYQRELNVMSQLTKMHHPHIMQYYGYVLKNDKSKDDGLYCFLQFCAGGSLKQMITRDNKISQLKTISLFKQLISAMVYINSMNKVHRDIKPDNLLLNENQELKIADFGLARDVDTRMTKGACTPLYASPQVMNLQPYDEKTDVWSAGLILYQMLVGKQFFKHVKTRTQLVNELKQFNKIPNKVKYPSGLHPQWEKLTNMMLTYSPIKRKSFKEMQNQFASIQQKLKNEIMQKYGYQTNTFDNFDDGLRFTKSICPYMSKPKPGQNIEAKFAQQKSFTNVNNLRKYLLFFRLKADNMIRLVKDFTANPYGCLKNVYKYLLMFLSLAGFIGRVNHHLNQLKNFKVSTPDGPLSKNDFIPEHHNEVLKMLQDFIEKHQFSLNKFKTILSKQINHKILNTYMKRPEDKGIIEVLSQKMGNFISLIERSNKNEFEAEDQYMDMFKKLYNHPDIHIDNSALESLTYEDLKTYANIRIIGNLDDVFLNGSYKQQEYLKLKRQDIQNKEKSDLLSFIKQFNIDK